MCVSVFHSIHAGDSTSPQRKTKQNKKLTLTDDQARKQEHPEKLQQPLHRLNETKTQNKQTKNSLTLVKHSSHSSYTVVMLALANLFIAIITKQNAVHRARSRLARC